MKRILIEGMSFNKGGMETFIYELYKAIKGEYQIDFLIYDDSIPFYDEFISNGSNIIKITKRSENYFKYKKDLDELFKNNHYDVFWSNRTSLSSITPFIKAKKYKVNKIFCHAHQSKNMGSSFTAVMHTLNRFLIRKYCTKLFACNNGAAEYFYKNVNDAININNPVSIDKYDYNVDLRERKRKELGLENNYIIGNVARFNKEKNHVFTINLFEELVKKIPNAVLLLCGQGELQNEIEALVHEKNLDDKVYFLGMRNDIDELLQAMDVFILPSLFEGLPFTLVEAQASGLPCIASTNVSTESRITDVISYISLENVDEWIDKLSSLKNYKRVSTKEQIVKNKFDFETFKEVIKNILE